jgi:hypothetical protein
MPLEGTYWKCDGDGAPPMQPFVIVKEFEKSLELRDFSGFVSDLRTVNLKKFCREMTKSEVIREKLKNG